MNQLFKENEYLRQISENVIAKAKPYSHSPSPILTSVNYSTNPNDNEVYKKKYYHHKRQDTKLNNSLYNSVNSSMNKSYMSPENEKKVKFQKIN